MSIRFKNVFNIVFPLLLASASSLYAQTVTVSPGTTYQTISGFGASSQWDNAFSASLATTFWSDDSSQPPANQVNGEVGLSILRLGIDDSGNANWGPQCAFATQALGINPNIKVFGSEWSPPAEWKNNGSVDGNNTGNDNGNPGTNTDQLNTADYANYAAYQTSWVTACKNTYGFTPYAISIQNEPDYDPSYDACLWSAQDFDTYIKTNLGPDLQAAGFGTSMIMMPESFADDLNLSATAMADSAAATFVKIIGMHLYGGGPNTVPTSYSTTAGHTVESWETEISEKTSDNNIDSGVYYADLLHSCIVDHDFNAFCYWWLVNINSDDEGLMTSASAPTMRLYCIGNFSKFVRPGFVRIGCTESPSAGVSVSAYYGSSTGKVVVVAINSNTSSFSLPVSYTGVNVTTVYPWETASGVSLVQQPSVTASNNSFTYTLPGQSVLSFVAPVSSGSTVTSTFTPTSTRTNTPTNSPTFTWTKTSTPTSTATASQTRTNTPTNTPTNTSVPPTSTFTPTFTSTPTKTNTPTGTATSTNTLANTATPTSTPTVTSTHTSTSTGTPTYTSTGTNTPTLTPTNTLTASATASRTPTASSTSTGTPSSTPTGTTTLTATITSTPTNSPTSTAPPTSTPTHTATPTDTLTSTDTATSTSTNTPTLTATPSSTPTGTATSTATSTSTSTATITSTPTNSPTGTEPPTDTPTPTATHTATSTATSTASNTSTATPTSTATLTVTRTSTETATFTPTNTPTLTTTNTATSTCTATPTFTASHTNTPVPPTATKTPTPVFTAVAFPNPVTGDQVSILVPLREASDVTVEIFTVAFRKVLEETFDNVQPGSPIPLELKSRWGTPLANGLYYVVVTAGGHTYVIKLLVIH